MDKYRIMIVDDEEHFLKLLELNLEMAGRYDVLALSSAIDILGHVQAFKPDLIILDLLIGSTRGVDVCQKLNDDPVGKGIPVIIFSALDKDEDKLKVFKLGVVDFLTKPLEIDVLVSAIEKALKSKRG
ncbi:MAG: response regulator [Candidatus Omnitrophica bacterium]|nr:response regulator [Candidatus Omnitrophota bacterium]MBU1852739.1 response regulator [Candidatus Omnitrophota bacterium]